MTTICVNDKVYSFDYVNISDSLQKALRKYESETGSKPWGFIMGVSEYASLVLYLKHHYLGDTSKPIIFNGVPCFPHKDYEGKIIILEDFESIVVED
ncbi:hypothetical protein N9948_00505 [bacterium]|nr:hypothetical protein [bacterium]